MADHDGAIPIVPSVSEVAQAYPAWLVDVWGVIHNGVAPFASAVSACQRRRQAGGVVVLITNAPRPGPAVLSQLDRIGVPRDAFDGIVTSGDVARGLVTLWKDKAIHHLGPDRDLPLFADLGISFVPSTEADIVVCTGLLDDETETPADYAQQLDALHRRGAVMVCANPDITVERGDKIVYCAGALGEAFEAIGGAVLYAGKPHAPIYELARKLIDDVAGRAVGSDEVLAIGDGIYTDIKGAAEVGIASLYVASAVNLSGGTLTPATLAEAFARSPDRPIAAVPQLAW
ncbi:MAG: TIGR01459 family HAD-type hydrolase [Pseudomonadota bacterium]